MWQESIAELLLDLGADDNAPVADGSFKTPLHVAVEQNLPFSVTALLDHGAHTDAVDRVNYTPLQLAEVLGHHHVARIINKHRLDGCLAAVPKMQCTDITGVVDSIKQAKKMPNNNAFCSSIRSAVTPVKLKGAATSGDVSPQKVSLAKQYADWYKNTIAPCVVDMCKTSAFPVAQADLDSAPVRAVEELITSQLSSWEKFAFVNRKGVAAGVVISFIVLLTAVAPLPHFLEEEEEEEEAHKASSGNQEVEEGEHGL